MAPPDWSFLSPWRDALRPHLSYKEANELEIGGIRNELDALQLHFGGLHTRFQAWGSSFADPLVSCHLVRVREGLELVGLALKYDRTAWRRFLHPPTFDEKDSEGPFQYDRANLCAKFEIVLAEGHRSDDYGSFDELHEMFTAITQDHFSHDYCVAKERIRALVGLQWDEDYRIPFSLVLNPCWRLHADDQEWMTMTQELVEVLRDAKSVAGSAFVLETMAIGVDFISHKEWWVDFIDSVRLAGVELRSVGVPFDRADSATIGIAVNSITGSAQANRLGRSQISTISARLHRVDHIAAFCSSISHARFLERLCVNCVDLEDPEAGMRWLGYAFANKSSVRELHLSRIKLDWNDMKCFEAGSSGTFHENGFTTKSNRWVSLDASASIELPDQTWQRLRDLHIPPTERFLDLNHGIFVDSVRYSFIVVPGFGVCRARSADLEHVQDKLYPGYNPPHLDSLSLDVWYYSPGVLPCLLDRLGRNLQRLSLVVYKELTLSANEANAILDSCPRLEFVHLDKVSFGSMDIFSDAYAFRGCRISTLSMVNSRVDSESMTRFALELARPRSPVFRRVIEFRYIFQLGQANTRKCPRIIDNTGALAFESALRTNPHLTMLEIGLVSAVYNTHADFLKMHDHDLLSEEWKQARLAFLSVVTSQSLPTQSKAKRSRVPWQPHFHRGVRRKLTTRILRFAHPQPGRTVSVLLVG